ncbi:MAG: EAL domain-containing protein, partial [Gammaproteobacteria bacterium]
RRVCPSSTHGVDCLDDHPNLDFGAQHARYGFGVQPKSDRLLVQGLIQNPDDKALAQSINGIGHMIGKRTIAKGVRDEALLAVVRSIGVDFAQGMEPTQALGDFSS